MDRRRFLRTLAPEAASYPPLRPPVVSTGLEPYTGPWDERQAAHLIRRTHFGLTRADLVAALSNSPSGAVDALVDAALARPLPDTPSWYNTTDTGQNLAWTYEWQEGWFAEMRSVGLRERMALLWHDHFATEVNVYYHAAFAYQYLTLLREHALGNFRDLLYEIGTLPAMLIYLDGEDSSVGNINENYGRELLELFSMGILGPNGSPNYTQQEIVEVARALTGWVVNMNTLRGEFVPGRHDSGPKTFFGQTGTWGYDDVIDIIFAQRGTQVAHHIARKLYSWFVYPAPNEQVVADLAQVLLSSGFDIATAVRTLLKSAHFFDDAFIGARIKSPVEMLIGLMRETGIPFTGELLERFREISYSLGQDVLNPPNVAGWPGYAPDEYRAWITTGTVPERRGTADNAVYGGSGFGQFDPIPLTEQISDPTSAPAIVSDFTAHFLPAPVEESIEDEMLDLLLDGAPVWEWFSLYQQNPEAARGRLRQLISYLVNLPEYQLT